MVITWNENFRKLTTSDQPAPQSVRSSIRSIQPHHHFLNVSHFTVFDSRRPCKLHVHGVQRKRSIEQNQNPKKRQLRNGLIIVWMLHRGIWFEEHKGLAMRCFECQTYQDWVEIWRWEAATWSFLLPKHPASREMQEMINNRNRSVVRDMKWSLELGSALIKGPMAVFLGMLTTNANLHHLGSFNLFQYSNPTLQFWVAMFLFKSGDWCSEWEMGTWTRGADCQKLFDSTWVFLESLAILSYADYKPDQQRFKIPNVWFAFKPLDGRSELVWQDPHKGPAKDLVSSGNLMSVDKRKPLSYWDSTHTQHFLCRAAFYLMNNLHPWKQIFSLQDLHHLWGWCSHCRHRGWTEVPPSHRSFSMCSWSFVYLFWLKTSSKFVPSGTVVFLLLDFQEILTVSYFSGQFLHEWHNGYPNAKSLSQVSSASLYGFSPTYSAFQACRLWGKEAGSQDWQAAVFQDDWGTTVLMTFLGAFSCLKASNIFT